MGCKSGKMFRTTVTRKASTNVTKAAIPVVVVVSSPAPCLPALDEIQTAFVEPSVPMQSDAIAETVAVSNDIAPIATADFVSVAADVSLISEEAPSTVQCELPVVENLCTSAEVTAAVDAPVIEQENSIAPANLPTSPMRFGLREASGPNVMTSPKAPVSFSEFVAENEAPSKGRKVVFDAETMRKTAPKQQPTGSKNLSKKQKEMLKANHISAGRRGPIASKREKGSKSQMQTDKYLEMAAAFERLLTNAATMDAHLDSR